MSDQLTAAAAALGAPEDLVRRSAEARAAADGTTTDEVLAAWAGGEALPAAAPAQPAPEAADAPSDAPEPEAAPEQEHPAPVAPEPATVPGPVSPVATRVATHMPQGPAPTPILEGQRSRPFAALVGIAVLFAVGILTSLSVPTSTGGDYTHLVPNPPLSATGEAGLDVYLEEGCWYCHTQLVRPVLADVGLGPATETFADSLSTAAFGVQRIGPDLAHVGSRTSLLDGGEPVTAEELALLLTDPHAVYPDGLHPSYRYLSEGDLAALTTYLVELK